MKGRLNMDKFNINKFYDNIDGFNRQGALFLKAGNVENAIETYVKKIEYIRYAYEFKVISFERACQMTRDTKRLIYIISG